MQIRPTAFTIGLIIYSFIALFFVYTEFGIDSHLASQSYPDPTTPFGKVVGNCGRVRGYRSKGDDLARYADRFGCDKYEADSLQKGNCFDNGPFWSRYQAMFRHQEYRLRGLF